MTVRALLLALLVAVDAGAPDAGAPNELAQCREREGRYYAKAYHCNDDFFDCRQDLDACRAGLRRAEEHIVRLTADAGIR